MSFIGRDPAYPIYPNIAYNPQDGEDLYSVVIAMDIPPLGSVRIQFMPDFQFIKLLGQDVNFLGGAVDFSILEGATCTPGSTALTPKNLDRRSVKSSQVLVTVNPTGITGGTDLVELTHFSIDLDISNAGGPEPSAADFVVLKQMTNYIFTFHNPSSTETVRNLHHLLFWAE